MRSTYPVQNGVKLGDVDCRYFRLAFRVCHSEGPEKTGRAEIEWVTSASGRCELLGKNVKDVFSLLRGNWCRSKC